MKNKVLPYRVYALPVMLLAAIGFAASLYLALSHYRNYTDINYSSFCAISKAINCDTVSQSSWSVLFGIPLAFWGTFAYALFFLTALPAQRNIQERRVLWDALFILAFIYSLADLGFGYISAIEIKAYCLMCLLTYATSFSLLFLTWIIRRRFSSVTSLARGAWQSILFLLNHKHIALAIAFLVLALLGLKIFLPTYWIYEYPELSHQARSGMTEDGHPWIGAEQPVIIIKELTDYQCFQCSKMHFVLRRLVNEHPNQIRLEHYHYPMDENFNTVLVKKPFHTGSGMLALLAIAAAKQDKFWQVNDALYSIAHQGIKEFNINKFAKKLELDAEKLRQDMQSQTALKHLESDIRTGLKNKVVGTPAFLIDGEVYQGYLPTELFKKIGELPK